VSRFYQSQSLDFEARWFPVLYVLKDHRSVAVTDLAEILGLTHPAINQIAGDMAKHDMIASGRDVKDERRRLLRLTPKAQQLLTELEPIWADIRTATAELITESGLDLIKGLDRVELQLNERDMCQRVESMQSKRQSRAQKPSRLSGPSNSQKKTNVKKGRS
jgi:DNA-binding MarR family transcriptional regulator